VFDALLFDKWHSAVGLGSGVLLLPKKDIFIRVEFAWSCAGLRACLLMSDAL
jgi:hypothetical protein